MTDSPLQRLARLHGVEDAYVDASGTRRQVADGTLFKVLAALGEPLESLDHAAAVLDGERARAVAGDLDLPSVVVAWEGRLADLPVAPADALAAVTADLALEDGGDADGLVHAEVRGRDCVVSARAPLPFGVHQLIVGGRPPAQRSAGRSVPTRAEPEPDEITVISAPSRARPVGPHAWGLFAPTYGLFDREGEVGSLTCLERFGRMAAKLGSACVATLPILADWSRAEDPEGGPSPYAPVSRLWWNEGYLDWRRVEELAGFDAGDRAPPGVADEPAGGPAPFDAGRRAAALRPLLEAAAARLEATGGSRLDRLRAFVAARPDVLTYARFRAAAERHGTDVRAWPSTWQRGLIGDADVSPSAVAAHVFAQFAMDEQLAEVAGSLSGHGAGLMLDLPVGCRAGGFDPWAYPESFVSGATVGAPPDQFFSGGQNWGFRPLHPEGERRSGYEVTGAALRHLLRHASVLRLDHVMGLSRLWWIPEGSPATDGAYVRYHLDEALALCSLEAWRSSAALVGEDLGTVEPSLTESLTAHGIAGMHVAVFDLEADDAHPMEPPNPRAGSAALVDTHDTATFAGWFTGRDIEERARLGLLAAEDVPGDLERRRRARDTLVDRALASDLLAERGSDDAVAVHAALLAELGQSGAGLVLVNVEDCWAEVDPQNIPGTTTEHANFVRPLALSLEEIESDERVRDTLAGLGQARLDRAARDAADEGGRLLDAAGR
jgi:4-alpha-glucanotransferase